MSKKYPILNKTLVIPPGYRMLKVGQKIMWGGQVCLS